MRESLGRLQIGYVDLIQTHDIEFTTMDQVSSGCRMADIEKSKKFTIVLVMNFSAMI